MDFELTGPADDPVIAVKLGLEEAYSLQNDLKPSLYTSTAYEYFAGGLTVALKKARVQARDSLATEETT